ncbi:hypothetical protein MFLAVUS_000715 [Mucor flavus]|uniref:Uncharacterized protein n=1 Tax=Mucor flavus TaxID=439312 RepID=A0ABP9YKJ1_9FUNG
MESVNTRTEISLISPSGIPRSYTRGTLPHSVVYKLSVEDKGMQNPKLNALKKAFPRGQGLGLISKTDTHFVYELALRTEDDCSRASDYPIVFQYENQYYSLKANIGIYGVSDIFSVALSDIMIYDFEYVKVYLLRLFSEHGVVLDIVLYEDDSTGSWFSGNGHVLIACSKEYRSREPPVVLLTKSSSPAVWTRLHHL